MKPLKITACLLLLLQAFHLTKLQSTTDSPGRTIDPSWLRHLDKKSLGSENTAFSEENELDRENDASESSADFNGVASGSMAVNTEEENMSEQDKSEIDTSDDLNISNETMISISENGTLKQPELPDTIDPPANATTDSTNSSQTNVTEAEEEFNSTMTAVNSTSGPDFSNKTVLQTTTWAPESNTTEQSTTTPDADKRLTNRTGSIDKSKTTTAVPEINKTSAGASTTTGFPSETTEAGLTTTAAVPNTPERANRTGKVAGGSDRGTATESDDSLESVSYSRKRNVAWLAVLGTAAATACVGVVAYIILKKKHQKAFTHRKLVEEYPSDPVLKLDNCEPLDLNFGGSAYYNPGLQGDNIQMMDIPGHR